MLIGVLKVASIAAPEGLLGRLDDVCSYHIKRRTACMVLGLRTSCCDTLPEIEQVAHHAQNARVGRGLHQDVQRNVSEI